MTPGSSCIANAYTSNHDLIASKDTGTMQGFALHARGCGRRLCTP